MDLEQLDKDKKIKSTVKHLIDKFGESNFKIKDYWDADLCAIGLTDNEEKYLVYFSTYDNNGIHVSLENVKNAGNYESAGDFDNLDIVGLEKVFAQHLRLKARK